MLGEVDFSRFGVELQNGRRIDHIGHLRTISDLTLRNNVFDLHQLATPPRLRRLTLRDNDMTSLRALTGAQSLRVLRGHGLWVESMSLDSWRGRELPAAAEEGLMIGINWSGPRLAGWSFTPTEVLNRLAAAD
ncbi:hypothetical protein ACWGQ5_42835 [Streptomyces sp. NPDC055722]